MQQQTSGEAFTFKENVITIIFVAGVFGLTALVIALAAFIKVSDGLIWALPGIVAAGVAVGLFYFVVNLIRSSQTITVTFHEITGKSIATGMRRIAWHDITDIREVQTRLQKARAAAPLIEVMVSLYFHLPGLATSDRRATLVFETQQGIVLTIRQHLVYPHRMDELRHAIIRYAPPRRQPLEFLKLNSNN